jgi:isopentenyldiphosphate isomerase
MTIEMLEIVDENDHVIGTAPRKDIHANGLLHREINVLFVTPSGEAIFQRRSKTKDICPGLLDAAAAGHVEIGDSYEVTALKEAAEETGLSINADNLVFIKKEYCEIKEKTLLNKCFRSIYGYVFTGSIDDMQIEEGAADGFEAYPIKDLLNMPANMNEQFISRFVDPTRSQDVYEKLLDMVTNQS